MAAPPPLVVLIGVPGSGKSTFARSLTDTYARVCQDELPTKQHCVADVKAAAGADAQVELLQSDVGDDASVARIARAVAFNSLAPSAASGTSMARRRTSAHARRVGASAPCASYIESTRWSTWRRAHIAARSSGRGPRGARRR